MRRALLLGRRVCWSAIEVATVSSAVGRRSADGELALAGALGSHLDLFHHLLVGLLTGEDGLPALVHRLLDLRREEDARRAGRLELQELRIERILQPRHLEGERRLVDRTIRR